MFRVGDRVECCVKGTYLITDVGVQCEVLRVFDTGTIEVEVLGRNPYDGAIFNVDSKYFCHSHQELSEDQVSNFMKFLEE